MTKIKYILGLSGGKDSAALALHMRHNHPEMDIDYFFTDTGYELPEVYSYLDKLEAILGKEIIRLSPLGALSRNIEPFYFWLEQNGFFLPSSSQRWCTIQMKLKAMEKWLEPFFEEGYNIHSFVGIRADENREGYKPTNPQIKVHFPFVEEGINKAGVLSILEDSGIGIPEYYKWRSRSGCTFCFFQQKIEWVRLLEEHPEAFEEARVLERVSTLWPLFKDEGEKVEEFNRLFKNKLFDELNTFLDRELENKEDEIPLKKFGWMQGETLDDLKKPDRMAAIKKDFEDRKQRALSRRRANPLLIGADDIEIDEVYGVDPGINVCVTCHK